MEKSSQKASFGQGLDLATIINKAVATAVKKNNISSEEIQAIIEKPGQIYQLVEDLLKRKETAKEEKILDLVRARGELTIKKTSGKETIANSRPNSIYVGSNFQSYGLNNKGEERPKTVISLYQVEKNATSSQLFYSINSDLDKLVLTQEQILSFCKKNSYYLSLYGDVMLFLIKEKNEYFVVYVEVSSGDFCFNVYPFEHDYVWAVPRKFHIAVPKFIES